MSAIIYTNCSTLGLGCLLYQDAGLTTPVANGEYSDGTDVFTVTGGAGEITASAICNPPTTTTTSTTTSTTTAPAGVSVTSLVGGYSEDGFGNFTPNCFVQINTTYPSDITFSTNVEIDSIPYVFNSVILAGNLTGGGDGSPTFGSPTAVTNQCIISCDTPAVSYVGYNCYTTQFAITNGSLDIAITNVIYFGSSPTYLGGQPLPNTTGNGTDLWFGYIGTYQTLDVYYTASVAGQHITVSDGVSAPQCQNTLTGSGVLSFPNVYFNGTTVVTIDAQDGTC